MGKRKSKSAKYRGRRSQRLSSSAEANRKQVEQGEGGQAAPRLQPLNWLMLLFLGIGGSFMWVTRGHYQPTLITIYTLAMLGLGLFWCKPSLYRIYQSFEESRHNTRLVERLLAVLISIFLLLNIIHAGPIYIDAGFERQDIRSMLGFPFTAKHPFVAPETWNFTLTTLTRACFIVVLLPFLRNPKHYYTLGFFVATLLLARKYLVLPASPAPWIDVFSLSWEAVHHLLAFNNPYDPSATYTDVYPQNNRNIIVEYIYLPLTLYAQTIGELLADDLRAGYLFWEIGLLLGLGAISAHLSGNYRAGLLICIAWLAIPVQMFIAEQSWTEIVILPFIVWGVYFLLRQQLLATAICFGLAVAAKQYAVLLIPLIATFIFKYHGAKNAIRFLVTSTMVVLLTFLPYLVIDFPGFLDNALLKLLTGEIGPSAFTVAALFINETDLQIPKVLGRVILVGLLLTAIAVTWFSSLPENESIPQLAVTLFLLYNLGFLFGHQGFCNYYFFTLIFPLLFLLLRMDNKPRPSVAES